MRRLMLLSATTGYQLRAFADAARRLGVDVQLGTDRCKGMDDPWGDHAIPVRWGDPGPSLRLLEKESFDAVIALGDGPTLLAAEAAAAKCIPFHPPAAVRACRDKFLARQLYQAARLPVPAFFRVPVSEGPSAALSRAPFPCVLKPLGLSGSRGVIRANDPEEFLTAFERIRDLLAAPDIRRLREERNAFIQVESYIEGREFAIEGLSTAGRFRPLAIFDKPDPLHGPYFEETIYTTPSREEPAVEQALLETVTRAVRALDLRHGPVHAEARVNARGVWMLEAAARPIGGLCARALRFNGGMPLEELLLRHALGENVDDAVLDGPASGVMMIPIPRGGVFQGVDGRDRAAAVPGIEDVVITAKEGQRLVPLPEGASYLGFIFSRGGGPAEVERALRRAHAELTFHIATALPTLRPSP